MRAIIKVVALASTYVWALPLRLGHSDFKNMTP